MDLLGIGGNKDILPMACMCSSYSVFACTRGDDGCLHCGCSCKTSKTNSGNSSTATWTIRKSGIPE